MDFSRPHIDGESVASRSKIRYIALPERPAEEEKSMDDRLIEAANAAARELLQHVRVQKMDTSRFTERMTPSSNIIQAGSLVVIFESFDNLNFVYATPKEIFSNRNGHFHHDDFIGRPFGCKLRSRNNRGYGFCYLLKPTPELWARSLNHRTQIVHELDASMVCFYLQLRPNMVVCETGTGSGAMSHAILRTIAPFGQLHTFEFNHQRACQATQEFAKNGLAHLVKVYHRDVCGKAPVIQNYQPNNNSNNNNNDNKEEATSTNDYDNTREVQGGFGLQAQSVDAVFLDLPEPWLAVPHAAYCLKANGRLASYSPCVEQTQRTVTAMRKAGFHSLKTLEFRIRENYVDEVDLEPPPHEKKPKPEPNPINNNNTAVAATSGEEDTGAEADNEKSEVSETEADQLSLTTPRPVQDEIMEAVPATDTPTNSSKAKPLPTTTTTTTAANNGTGKRKKVLVARPFVMMRGHTAFLTFATAGNRPQPDPNQDPASKDN